jgi:lipoyl-dependent peroxiredoxin
VATGGGTLRLGSGAFEGPYSLKSRIDEVAQANPEELIGAAHAGCFSMALSSILEEAGRPPVSVETDAKVRLEETPTGFAITRIELVTRGDVPGLDEAGFMTMAERAKETCPVSRALAGVEIVLEASLTAEQAVET